ncbi:MAG: transglutaminase domain-containing protein [Deltaproteobacteria bacterium]|nr:transglutaminase domain-containing protein [Deltaproteobacteria bacterium]MBW2070085.1 transglutaminase domain-containing protein [Deltaproteobacteria bacterium]
MKESRAIYLQPTAIIDSDQLPVERYAKQTVAGCYDQVEQAVRLYLAVRDGIRYDPYCAFHLPVHYQASKVLAKGRGFCVPKASLLCALARACGIPTRLGFATVRNHLATKQLLDFLGSNLFVYHGFVEFYLEGKWVKATPTFNRELCERHGVPPLEFDGRHDSLFHPYDAQNNRFMEYVAHHGTFADVPVDLIVAAWKDAYGEARVQEWIQLFAEKEGVAAARDFTRETVCKD